MRGKKGRNYISRQACFVNRFTLQGFKYIYINIYICIYIFIYIYLQLSSPHHDTLEYNT